MTDFSPENPSPTPIACRLGCGHQTTTGICADCAFRHDGHGQGDAQGGPDDPDCPCRTTAAMYACSQLGCGFCKAHLDAMPKVGVQGIGFTRPRWACIFTDANGKTVLKLGEEGIVFGCGDAEVLRLQPDGKAFVLGELMDSNSVLYKALNDWFNTFGMGVK